MSKSSNPLDQMIKNSTAFSNQYSDACTKSSAILMKGLEDIVGTATSLIQNSTEKQTKFVKQVMNIKDINQFAEIQGKIVQESLDDLISGITKISELSVKVISDSSEPLNAELNKAVKKATSSMAA